ncbi:MAG: 4-hydroxythreonine-4-phosphate dehydrogenase PdxA [Balneolaceae bacterium]|nr:4-hydroxythreonine-4-phosphate dehydrogenase PdxA [Balneolaceae bacterium]
MNIKVAITTGDINGIGTEIILKTLSNIDLIHATPVILGSSELIEYYDQRIQSNLDLELISSAEQIKIGKVNLLECVKIGRQDIEPGKITEISGAASMKSVEEGIRLCLEGLTDALVTAPISKEAVNLAGYSIPGHTEFLAEKTGTDRVLMMLVNESFRLGLATIHIPVSRIHEQLSKQRIVQTVGMMDRSLREDFGIENPEIAVLGLNPHAGDGGVIGDEEIEVIGPAIEKARENDLNIEGPFPADGFFGNRKYRQFHGVIAMYHDQGLIPFKTISFGKGVNFTAGLPFVRTSPDHGTAFDIAGENKANPASFREALQLAGELSKNRKEHRL